MATGYLLGDVYYMDFLLGSLDVCFDGWFDGDIYSGYFEGEVDGEFCACLDGYFEGWIDGMPYFDYVSACLCSHAYGYYAGNIYDGGFVGMVDGCFTGAMMNAQLGGSFYTVTPAVPDECDGWVEVEAPAYIDAAIIYMYADIDFDGYFDGEVEGFFDGEIAGYVEGGLYGWFTGLYDGRAWDGFIYYGYAGYVEGYFTGYISDYFAGNVDGHFTGEVWESYWGPAVLTGSILGDVMEMEILLASTDTYFDGLFEGYRVGYFDGQFAGMIYDSWVDGYLMGTFDGIPYMGPITVDTPPIEILAQGYFAGNLDGAFLGFVDGWFTGVLLETIVTGHLSGGSTEACYVVELAPIHPAQLLPDTIIVHQETKAHLAVVIFAPMDGDEVTTCQQFELQAWIINEGMADALDVEATLSVEPQGSVRVTEGGYTQYVGYIAGDSYATVNWTLHCKQVCESTLTVTASGIDENTGKAIPEENTYPDSVTVKQVESPESGYLVVDVVAPHQIYVGTEFEVIVVVGNIGGTDATDVDATITISGNASTAEPLTKNLGTIAAGDEATVSWTLSCDGEGGVGITVSVAGTDTNTAVGAAAVQQTINPNVWIDYLKSISASLEGINGTMALINTTLGEMKVSLASINATLVSIDGNVLTIATALGDIEAALVDIDATLVDIEGCICTINTTLGEITGELIEIMEEGIVVIHTDLGQIRDAIAGLPPEEMGQLQAWLEFPDTIMVGDDLTVIAVVANIGGGDADDITAKLEVIGPVSLTNGATWDVGDLAAGTHASHTWTLHADGEGTVKFILSAKGTDAISNVTISAFVDPTVTTGPTEIAVGSWLWLIGPILGGFVVLSIIVYLAVRAHGKSIAEEIRKATKKEEGEKGPES